MKKFIIAVSLLLMVSIVSSTSIASEDVEIDLSDNHVTAEIDVKDLTSEDFTYISNLQMEDLNVTHSNKKLNCTVSEQTLGSKAICEINETKNFTVKMEFNAEGLVEKRNGLNVFRYRQPIYRPTTDYNLKVILPEGSALLDPENNSQQVISPKGFEPGSTGRRITVNWNINPDLGTPLNFFILYENVQQEETNPLDFIDSRLIGIITLILFTVLAGILGYRWNKKDLKEEYEDLDEDEKEIIDLIKENEGEYLQKELVDELEYSKAKVSGIVSDLVEKGVLNKSKEGRSNKLSISRKYRY